MTNENDVKNAIIKYLTLTGWLVIRVNSGAATGDDNGKRRFVSFVRWFCGGHKPQTAGISDILAFHPDYPPLAIECKAPGRIANVSEVQRKFMDAWRDHGGVAVAADNLDDIIYVLGEEA